ncbi:MAG: sulfotransferase [Hydrococcus sp. C42_A2020_068]|uniref:sulfotransferase n=1 Tax=Pleurocapsa sp. PCC 7327 TaxID=118163 RepID=UPI00029FDA51|nr:sulfotransferase [Pleurocapsa sp. PCC 7327]AFY77448.1 hypothetical protein Ple7327_2124 [Pleurocapsa sp. PCC 7327]MBF2020660.1 sulfotransferase [Hydrococcus sp. C42_A2020_068]
MRNVVILGSGRSGTSMVAGTLSQAGYFMGEDFWPTRNANPKGFFEDVEINEINEDILEPVIPKRLHIPAIKIRRLRLHIPERAFFRNRPLKWHRWLACVPVKTEIPSSPQIIERIQKITKKEPYCLKDPRFSYTLPVWKPYLKDTAFICVFRDPASTVLSILKECSSVDHLCHEITGIRLSWQQALEMWTLMYEHILEKHSHEGEWLFIHYNQAVSPEGLNRLETFTGASVDRSFPNPNIRRSFSDKSVPKKTMKIYQKLCELANYEVDLR